ncbi:MAG: hypothetical protein KDI46_01620 [Alphaproteobacteria bacterium]|nr:hypothetical protein [Alphaproteobacteria bacterium]
MKKFKAILYSTIVTASLLGMPGVSQAQQIKSFYLDHSGMETLQAPTLEDETDNLHAALFLTEPYFKEVKFLKMEPALSLTEKIDRLSHGINTDIPPEYDYYGYEVRRYMAAVGNASRFQEPTFIDDELHNIANAKIVLEYWRKELEKQMDEIEAEIDERDQVETSIRTSFRYNRGLAIAFFVEAEGWINNNELLLLHLKKIGPRAYNYDPEKELMVFKNRDQMREFTNIYQAKLQSLFQIRRYMPFRMMVY